MKKLLLVAALLAVGASAYALTYTNNYPVFNSPTVAGENVGFGAWRDITDANRNEDQVNRFIKKGKGWVDHTLMFVALKVHKPVCIKPETYLLYGEGVQYDKLEFGDVQFYIRGTKDAKAKFTFYGDVFDMLKAVTLESQGNVVVEAQDGFNGKTVVSDTIGLSYHKDEADVEMDLYFKLEDVGFHPGIVLATAYYE